MSIDQLIKEYDIEIKWTTYPFHTDIPEEGILLKDRFPQSSNDIMPVKNPVEDKAAELGLPFKTPERLYNTRLIQELSKWADSLNKGNEFHHAAFRAHYVEGKNISDIRVLCDLAEDVGLSTSEARAVLEDRKFIGQVDEDWEKADELQIAMVPTFILEDNRLVGWHPYDKLLEMLEMNGVKRKK